MNYNALVEQHFFAPQNVGDITQLVPFVTKVTRGDATIGEKVVLSLACDSNRIISIARYRVLGNPYTIAAMSLMSGHITGMTLTQASRVTPHPLVQQLAIPSSKLYSALLIIDVIHAAVAQLQQHMRSI